MPLQVLKLYAWEGSFAENVKHIRDKEIRLLKKLSMLRALNMFLFNTTPFLVSACHLLSFHEIYGPPELAPAQVVFFTVSVKTGILFLLYAGNVLARKPLQTAATHSCYSQCAIFLPIMKGTLFVCATRYNCSH